MSVAYQNKDITSKVFADRFKGKALRVYGISLPAVKQALPTNLPAISANELRPDNVFLLEDGSIAIIDYESAYRRENKHKYIDYANKIAARYEKEWNRRVVVRMIVIYTADVERADAHDEYDAGCLRLETESAYLSEIGKERIQETLERKIGNKEPLTDEEMMEFILLPLAYKGRDRQNDAIARNADLARNIEDEEARVFLLSGLVVFSDKVINDGNAARIRRMINMTKVGQLFIDEMEQKLDEKEREVTARV